MPPVFDIDELCICGPTLVKQTRPKQMQTFFFQSELQLNDFLKISQHNFTVNIYRSQQVRTKIKFEVKNKN